MTDSTTNRGDSTTPRPHPTPPRPQLAVYHDYHSAVNEITEPDKYVACSRYFVRRWMPLLGGVATQVVLSLRSLGYYNQKTGEKRDGIEIDFPELAQLVGVSVPTLKRLLQADEATGALANPILAKFVTKDRQYWRDPVTNRLLRSANVYRVKMDDPLHEDDEPRLNEILRSRDKANVSPVRAVKTPVRSDGRVSEYQSDTQVGQSPKDHFDTQVASKYQNDSFQTQSDSKKSQIESPESQFDTTLKDYSETQENTFITPAAPGESLSLFGEEVEGEGTAPSAGDIASVREHIRLPEPPRPPKVAEIQSEWDAMTPEGRDAYRPEAVRQLIAGGQPSPPEAMVLPRMFRLFWAQRKGLGTGGGGPAKEKGEGSGSS